MKPQLKVSANVAIHCAAIILMCGLIRPLSAQGTNPIQLTATALSETSIELEFTHPSPNIGEIGAYLIQRRLVTSSVYENRAWTGAGGAPPGNVFTWTDDIGLQPGETYRYRVVPQRIDGSRILSESAEATVTTPAPPPVTLDIINITFPLTGHTHTHFGPFGLNVFLQILWDGLPYRLKVIPTFQGNNQTDISFSFATSSPNAPGFGSFGFSTTLDGTGRLILNGYDDNDVLVARGEVDNITINNLAGMPPPNCGCSRVKSIQVGNFTGHSAWYSGSGTYTLNLVNEGGEGWKNGGICIALIRGDGRNSWFCDDWIDASMSNLQSMGYVLDDKTGKFIPDGFTVVETDDFGYTAWFTEESGTIYLDVFPNPIGTCTSPGTVTCLYPDVCNGTITTWWVEIKKITGSSCH